VIGEENMQKKEDLRVTKTKKNLYEALIYLMKDKTFEEIKVSDICEKSLTNRSTFYDHFADKYELLSSLIHDLEQELVLKLQENDGLTTKDFYMKMIEALLEHLSENIDIYSSALKNNTNSIANDMIRTTLYKDVLKHLETIERKSNIPIEIITVYYVSAVTNVCVYYLNNYKKYSAKDILKYFDELIPNNIY